jgi:hypothetical protein
MSRERLLTKPQKERLLKILDTSLSDGPSQAPPRGSGMRELQRIIVAVSPVLKRTGCQQAD